MRVFSTIFCFLIILCISTPTFALNLGGVTILEKGQHKFSLGAGVLFGVVSPPATFSHNPALNKARVFEETLSYTYGFGNAFLKDLFVEAVATAFQSKAETVNGAQIHSSDSGFALTIRGGGNFIHSEKVLLGLWIESTVPIVMDKNKFVNPVFSYVGGGLNGVFKFSKIVGLNQSIFLGSGLFSPNRRNPFVQSKTLGLFNIGQLIWKKNLTFSTGIVIESDLSFRTDSAYAASAIADGRIKNLVFISPFLFDIPLGKGWDMQVGHAIKFAGKSSRGSQFSKFSLSKTF